MRQQRNPFGVTGWPQCYAHFARWTPLLETDQYSHMIGRCTFNLKRTIVKPKNNKGNRYRNIEGKHLKLSSHHLPPNKPVTFLRCIPSSWSPMVSKGRIKQEYFSEKISSQRRPNGGHFAFWGTEGTTLRGFSYYVVSFVYTHIYDFWGFQNTVTWFGTFQIVLF